MSLHVPEYNYTGEYNPETPYEVWDVVWYTDHNLYHLAHACDIGTPPTDTRYWNKIDPIIQQAVKLSTGDYTTHLVESMVHTPVVGDNGNWFLWSVADQDYVDSGKPSRGIQGPQGDPAPASEVQPAVNAYLATVITNPDSPPLDRNLSSAQAAAPADMVGSLKSAVDDVLWDDKITIRPTWERGTIDIQGQDAVSNTLYRSVGYYPIQQGIYYTLDAINGNGILCRRYNANKEYVDTISAPATQTSAHRESIFSANGTFKYMRFVITRYDGTFTADPANVTIQCNNPIPNDLPGMHTNREYASRRGYGYLGITYQSTDGTADSDRTMLMYLSPNALDWYKIGKIENCPINGWDYSAIYKSGYFYIAYDYADKNFNNWTPEDDTYNRGGNRIGVLKTADFVLWENIWITLPLEWKSTWAPELFVENNNFYISLTVSDGSKIGTLWNGDQRYQKDTVLLLDMGTTITDTPAHIYDITPSVIDDPFIIDPCIIKKGSYYYLCLKDEKTARNTLYKSTSLMGTDWAIVTSFVGKMEGVAILYDSRIAKYLAFADLRFTNKSSDDFAIARRQYGIAVSDDMENWSQFVSIDVQGDAPLRHFTPLILDEYSAPRVTAWVARMGKNDAQVDETKSFGAYGLIAQNEADTVIACDTYNQFVLKPNAVYRVSGGDITVNAISPCLMCPGDMCTFVLADAESSITFAADTIRAGSSVTLDDISKMLLVICTNAKNTNINAFTIRSGTEARGFIVG